ncbi:hypothetical protein RMCBS344292_17117 [Rhizopus microsporus]|nr:hypothetical protein RMCBS344292_17117 [Rhizopus microsporus]
MEDLMLTMFLLALWYTVADIGLIWQVIYYQQVTLYTKLKQEESSNESTDMAVKKSALWINLVGLSVLITVVVVSCYAYNSDLFNNSNSTLSGLIGWASAVLYIGSRLPQIIKNWKAQSTEGLSSGMFICALFGNFSFTLSIFLKSTEKPYILQNLPWIVGSLASDFRLKENKHPFVFENEKGHVLVIAFITSSIVRVQYLTELEREQQIKEADCMADSVDVKLSNTCVDGQLLTDTLELKTLDLRLVITLQPAFQLKWYPLEQQDASEFPFAEDLLYRAYAYDKATDDKWHYQRKYDSNLYYGLGSALQILSILYMFIA